MTGSGFSLSFFGDWTFAWLSLVVIVLLAMICRRQTQDGVMAGMNFNVIGAFVGGIFLNILLITFTGDARWSLLAGIAGIVIGGFLLGMIANTNEGDSA